MALNRFYLTENSIAQRSGLCIFISHQKRDADTAKKIADYLLLLVLMSILMNMIQK